jgi:hypothetical protein
VTRRLGLTRVDFVIGAGALALIVALLHPALRARGFRGLVENVVLEVEAMRSGAVRAYESTSAWPRAGGVGEVPPALTSSFGGDTALIRDGYALQWTSWEVVEEVEAATVPGPPPSGDAPPDSVGPPLVPVVRTMGGVVVHSSREALLAELLARYGPEISFVRDSTWTLRVPRPDGGP